LPARGCLLHEQRKPPLVKFVEPFVPGDLFQFVLSRVPREIEANHTYIFAAASSAHASRTGIALFRPAADFIMIG
jgi:hypothetical protein